MLLGRRPEPPYVLGREVRQVPHDPGSERLTTLCRRHGVDLYGCFLDDDHILLTTHEHGFWLAGGDLTAITPIELPDQVIDASRDFSLTMGLSADTFSTRVLRDNRNLSTVWRLR